MEQKFAIGRYYLNSLFKDEANKTFIEDLMKEPYISEKSFDYAIGNLNSETEQGYEITRGTFGRIRKGYIAEVYDKDKKEFKKGKVTEVADITLEFIINHKTHLIFLEYSTAINEA